ncbi:hypothetical protein ACWCOU_43890, partial [Actinomadura luteofluorescens]
MDGQPKNFTRSTRSDRDADGVTAPGPGAAPPEYTARPAAGPAAGPIPDPFDEDTPRTPDWFKTAVFYEVSVRGFADSNNDGYGDLRGLISKLDHL